MERTHVISQDTDDVKDFHPVRIVVGPGRGELVAVLKLSITLWLQIFMIAISRINFSFTIVSY